MSKSDRDPLFFPPHKHPPELEDEAEEYSAEVDPAQQSKMLKRVLAAAAVMGLLIFLVASISGC
jgi:hypothetical protein